MATTVKLQKIGNSIRATIPKEVAEELSLKPGEEMVVDTAGDALYLRKRTSKRLSDLYGALAKKRGEVASWPTPDEIKAIWG
jgi:AbrB family looped-hinge helix DNA binding protein